MGLYKLIHTVVQDVHDVQDVFNFFNIFIENSEV